MIIVIRIAAYIHVILSDETGVGCRTELALIRITYLSILC